MPKVSIVMPAYKVEKYFVQSLESVINQTLTDIEIIPVDDGSPDNCGRIMDEYAVKDRRIKPIHQENGGYGKAVNAGINATAGEYIAIVETDDWAEPDMFEKLYERAKELDVDVCKADYRYYFGDGRFREEHFTAKIAPEREVFTLKENPKIMRSHVSIWSAIYRKSYLDKHNIRLEESRSAVYQDMPFAALVYSKGAKITVIHDSLINYRMEAGSDSSTLRTDGRLKMMPVMCRIAKKYFIENDCWEEVKEIAYRHFYNCSVCMWFQTDDEFKRAHFDELYKLFKDIPNENVKLKYFLRDQKKIMKLIIKNDFETLYKNRNKLRSGFLKTIRRNIIQIRWNRDEKLIRIFGRELYSGKNCGR